jgi:NDP-sugar pyrophosphorylase family protein
MILANGTKRPKIHSSAYIAPSAVVSGDVTIGQNCAILHGAVIVASGYHVTIGNDCVISEHAVVRSTPAAAVKIGDEVLVGPHATVVGVALPNGTRLPANEVRLPAGDPYGPTKAYAESLRKLHAKDAQQALHENVAPGGNRREDTLQAPVEADTVVDIMMLELQEMEHRRAEAKRKK